MTYNRPTDGLDKDARLHVEGVAPTDIMREASKWTAKCYQPETGTWFDVRDNIASAILAERQRCAGIAQRWANDNYQAPEPRLIAAYINRSISRGETT